MKMNKKGEKYLSVYWFVILAIVAVGIVAMVFVFYGKPYDVREVEAGMIINKVVDCLSAENGRLKQINNLQECHFNFGEEFYLDVDSLNLVDGNSNLKDSCGKAKNVVCVEKKVYFLDEENNEIIIKVLSVVGKDA